MSDTDVDPIIAEAAKGWLSAHVGDFVADLLVRLTKSREEVGDAKAVEVFGEAVREHMYKAFAAGAWLVLPAADALRKTVVEAALGGADIGIERQRLRSELAAEQRKNRKLIERLDALAQDWRSQASQAHALTAMAVWDAVADELQGVLRLGELRLVRDEADSSDPLHVDPEGGRKLAEHIGEPQAAALDQPLYSTRQAIARAGLPLQTSSAEAIDTLARERDEARAELAAERERADRWRAQSDAAQRELTRAGDRAAQAQADLANSRTYWQARAECAELARDEWRARAEAAEVSAEVIRLRANERLDELWRERDALVDKEDLDGLDAADRERLIQIDAEITQREAEALAEPHLVSVARLAASLPVDEDKPDPVDRSGESRRVVSERPWQRKPVTHEWRRASGFVDREAVQRMGWKSGKYVDTGAVFGGWIPLSRPIEPTEGSEGT